MPASIVDPPAPPTPSLPPCGTKLRCTFIVVCLRALCHSLTSRRAAGRGRRTGYTLEGSGKAVWPRFKSSCADAIVFCCALQTADAAAQAKQLRDAVYALLYLPAPFCAMGQNVDFAVRLATMPGQYSGDHVDKVKRATAPLFF